MPYDKQTWANDEGGGTPLDADRLNHMEDGIDAATATADTAVQPDDLGALAAKNAVEVADIDATGTPGASTFLRGDGAWQAPAGGGDMAAATYDPQAIEDDAFARANHTGTQAAGTITGLATVATTGAYSDLDNLPTLGTAAAEDVGAFATAAQGTAADAAVPKASGVGVAEHGATAGTARPTGYAVVHWYGTVEPENATDNDLWYDTTT